MAVGLASLQYVLEEGSRNDWFELDARSPSLSFVAVFGLAAFIIRELTAPVPAVDLRLFRDRVFLSGTLIGAADVRDADGRSVPAAAVHAGAARLHRRLQSGIALMPRALAMMVGIPLVGPPLQQGRSRASW